MTDNDLARLNMKIAFDALEDACIALREAMERLESNFRELREAVE